MTFHKMFFKLKITYHGNKNRKKGRLSDRHRKNYETIRKGNCSLEAIMDKGWYSPEFNYREAIQGFKCLVNVLEIESKPEAGLKITFKKRNKAGAY